MSVTTTEAPVETTMAAITTTPTASTPVATTEAPVATATTTPTPTTAAPVSTAAEAVTTSAAPTTPADPESAGFKTRWRIPADDLRHSIPINPDYADDYDYGVDWGDGNSTRHTGEAVHEYAAAGEYTITITGAFPAMYLFNSSVRGRLLRVEQWDRIAWRSMRWAFAGAANLEITAVDAPDLRGVADCSFMFYSAAGLTADLNHWDVSHVTDMSSMFSHAETFNGDIRNWDVSNVTDMALMFHNAHRFNGDLRDWDVSSVTDMLGMFSGATAFNGDLRRWNVSNVTNMRFMFSNADAFNSDISRWDVSGVTNMREMFERAVTFNSDISDWDVSNVTDMKSMFYEASAFNSDLSRWDVSRVTRMRTMFFRAAAFNSDLTRWDVSNITDTTGMFSDASSFNGDVSDWDVSNVTDMLAMFDGAVSFDQNLGAWNVSNVFDMTEMLRGVTLSIQNYDALLIGWSSLAQLEGGIDFDAGNSRYSSAAIAARGRLADPYPHGWGWTIVGDSLDADYVPPPLPPATTTPVGGPDGPRTTPAPDPTGFRTVWRIPADGLSHTIPINPDYASDYDYGVDWGDGSITTGHTGEAVHAYAAAGEYTVTITGDFPAIYLQGSGVSGRLLRVERWGRIIWRSMRGAFSGAENLKITAVDAPDLSQVTDCSRMFHHATGFTGDLNHWDVSRVTNMSSMFSSAEAFNSDLDRWNVSNVTRMSLMFFNAHTFNGDIRDWDVSNVTDMLAMFGRARAFNSDLKRWDVSNVRNMSNMFANAGAFSSDLSRWDVARVESMEDMFSSAGLFNSDISNWNVANVTSMGGMFHSASAFNSDISDWDVSNVGRMRSMFSGAAAFNSDLNRWDVSNITDMTAMFADAGAFNGDVGDWDVSNVTEMLAMFDGAVSFDQNLGDWDVSNVLDMTEMLRGVTLSIQNYDALLIGWSELPVQRDNELDAGGSQYSRAAVDARAVLTERKGWAIFDGGLDEADSLSTTLAVTTPAAVTTPVVTTPAATTPAATTPSPTTPALTTPIPTTTVLSTARFTAADGSLDFEFYGADASVTVVLEVDPPLTAPADLAIDIDAPAEFPGLSLGGFYIRDVAGNQIPIHVTADTVTARGTLSPGGARIDLLISLFSAIPSSPVPIVFTLASLSGYTIDSPDRFSLLTRAPATTPVPTTPVPVTERRFTWEWSQANTHGVVFRVAGEFRTWSTGPVIDRHDVHYHVIEGHQDSVLLFRLNMVNTRVEAFFSSNNGAYGIFKNHDFEYRLGANAFVDRSARFSYPVQLTAGFGTPSGGYDKYGIEFRVNSNQWWFRNGPGNQPTVFADGFASGPVITEVGDGTAET